jgi:AcrR family transcriptional regulator
LLLHNAAELFARKGFEGVTVREIAELSDVTMPTLYHFFGDKRGIYLEACKHEFLDVTKRLLLAASGTGDSFQRLYNFTVEQCHVLLEPRPIAQLLRRELLEQDVEGIAILTNISYKPLLEEIAALVRDIAPERDAVATVITIHALIMGFTDMAPIQASVPVRPSLPVGAEQTARFVLSIILPEFGWPPERPEKR